MEDRLFWAVLHKGHPGPRPLHIAQERAWKDGEIWLATALGISENCTTITNHHSVMNSFDIICVCKTIVF